MSSNSKPSIALVAIVTIGCIAGLIGALYYAIPGYIHVLAVGNPTSTQPTGIAVSLLLFVVSFIMALYITPNKTTCPSCQYMIRNTDRYCARCGCLQLTNRAGKGDTHAS
jgi:hypothetical protein